MTGSALPLSPGRVRAAATSRLRVTPSPGWLAVLAVLCMVTGVVAGINPKYGLLVPLGLAFAAAVVANVTVGVFLFTFLAWLNAVTKGGTAVSGAKVAGLLLFVSWFAAKSVRRDPDARPFPDAHPGVAAAAVLLATWSAVSIVWAHSRGTAGTATYQLMLDMTLFPIIYYGIRRREHFMWIVGAFVLGALLSALIGLGQSGSRQTGALGDADTEGTLLATALILLFGLVAAVPRGTALRRWGPLAMLIMALGVVNAGSRGGLLALVCGVAAGVVFGGRWRGRAIATLLVVAAAAGIYLVTLAPQAAGSHLTGTGSTGRTSLWKVGLKAWEDNPLLGVGAGNFSSVSVEFVQQVDNVTAGQYIISQKPKLVHNTYLEQLADLGVLGLIAFVAIAAGSVAAALKAAHIYERIGDSRAELMSRCVVLAVVAELVGAFFITATPLKLLWLILALPFPLLAVARREARTAHPR